MNFHLSYHLKTLLYGIIPGGIGHHRFLHQYRDRDYNHARDMHPVRLHHNRQKGWSAHGRLRRDYRNYEEYVVHQAQKFNEILRMRGGFPSRTIVTWRRRFFARFKHLMPLLGPDAVILCLGARQGTEVEVLRDLGYHNAYGVDLNPGPCNPYVRIGDFMHLREADQSIDCIYTNCVDHAFALDGFLAEHRRVLKPTGLALYDLPRYSGTRKPGAFEAIGWTSEHEIVERLAQSYAGLLMSRMETKWQWVLFQGPRKLQPRPFTASPVLTKQSLHTT